jgi:hypothetical protein
MEAAAERNVAHSGRQCVRVVHGVQSGGRGSADDEDGHRRPQCVQALHTRIGRSCSASKDPRSADQRCAQSRHPARTGGHDAADARCLRALLQQRHECFVRTGSCGEAQRRQEARREAGTAQRLTAAAHYSQQAKERLSAYFQKLSIVSHVLPRLLY